jgi:hypothetical protein
MGPHTFKKEEGFQSACIEAVQKYDQDPRHI